ncbi:Y-family DNA polymerase [Spirosoma foliorum]|uniref:Y-family DNA polymerase n=1 Tax=Spirosoma foliorum TaxID=2710596 RepID=A0A7G5GTU1_9BACT|nr:Y-family DNA polymerase [Spirosoma foliorum]QMW02283.1 Y-family DNA polymerase [Spirosoma foliorum]
MVALVDANSFYASCHQIFRPDLEGKPIIVLSNRDGNVVARSKEAKELGIKMGQAFFETKELVNEKQVVVFSSNYELYGDISARMMSVLTQFAPDVEVYSIDEAFLQLEDYTGVYPTYKGLGQAIRTSIRQWLRLPVGVGVGPTKTLAKVANRLAKIKPECHGVCVLETQADIDEALWGFPVEELWGVGGRSASKLKREGIRTAYQLRDVNDDWIRGAMTVNGLRLVHELRGLSCKLLEVNQPPRKSICTEPGFGKVIPDLDNILDALTTHLSRVCEKLRKQESLCGAVTVWLRTDPHRRTPGNGLPAKQYSTSVTVRLPHPTSSTLEIIRYAESGVKAIFKFGYNYLRVGIMLTDLVPADYRQVGVFTKGPDERLIRLSQVMDKVNKRYGHDTLRMASQMYNPEWPMKQKYLSPRYTTRWEDILEVK